MKDLVEKAKELINQHQLTTTLSTVDKNCNVDVAIADIILMTDPETIKVAGITTKKSYENLISTKKGMFMVVVPGTERPDGIRIAVELIKDETEGEDFETMQAFAREAYGGAIIKNLLTFRITGIKPVRD